MMRHILWMSLFVVALAAACDDSDSGDDPTSDVGGSDAAADVALDVANDAAADAASDVGVSIPDPSTYTDCAAYADRGPNPVGVKTVEIDGSPVEVWYPAQPGSQEGESFVTYDIRDWLPAEDSAKIPDDAPTTFETGAYRDLPIADGSHPVVLFSHGLAGYRLQSTAFTTHLASWGFVVAAPEHPERGLEAVLGGNLNFEGGEDVAALVATLDWAAQVDAQADSFWAEHLETAAAAVTGHSAGGRAALATAAQDERFVSVVGLAPAVSEGITGGVPPSPDARQMHVAGQTDGLVTPNSVLSFWEEQTSTKFFASIAGAGHLAFADICLIGREEGGILEIAQNNGVEVSPLVANLARDGCRDDQLDPRAAWPVFHHFATAELRVALGLDASPTDLDAAAAQCFGDLVADFQAGE